MQSFTYKGQKYSFSDGTSNDDALLKIKTHLGETGEKTTSVGEDLATGFAGVGNLVDTGVSLAASALARPFDAQGSDDIFKNLNQRIEERNKWANPEGKKQTTGGKLISAIPGALGIPFAGFNLPATGKEMLDAGESLPKSLAAGAGDAALQFATMGIPMPGKGVATKALSTGAFNAAQNALTDLGISTLADSKQIKEAHNPADLDKALVSFVSGGIAGGVAHKLGTKTKAVEDSFDAKLQAALDAKKTPDYDTPENAVFKEAALDRQRNEQTVQRLEAAIAKQNPEYNDAVYVGQEGTAIPGEQGRAMMDATRGVEYEQVPPDGVIPRNKPDGSLEVPKGNDWPVDENGIPVRQGLPENKLAPPETYHESQAVNDLGNAIQEANGPKLGPNEAYGADNLSGPMGAPELPKFSVPKGQRGAIDLGTSQKEKQEIISKIVGTKHFTPPPTVEELTAQSLASGKDGKGWNITEAGGSLTAEKRDSPLIRGGVRIVQHQKNIAEDSIRASVFPVEKKLRSLSSNELVQLAKVMKAEMFAKQTLSTKELADLGLSEKQLMAYDSIRDMYKQALDKENQARVLQGKEPITAQEAYLSSRWQGDFRRAIYDTKGKLVWYLAANSKKGLDIQAQALVKKFPDLAKGQHVDHVTRSMRGSNMDAQSMYTTMLDVLGRDDPAVQKIKEWAESKTEEEGRGVFAQEKHFKNKYNIRGFVGDRPSNTLLGKLNPQKEALDMFQQQITYAKNAHKWAGMQEAGAELKKVFSNGELAAQQPHNMEYLKDYFREQVGMGTSRAVSGIEDAFKSSGISPQVVNNGIGNIKNLWITQKLVASLGFMASNVIQAGNMLPHIADMQVKYGGNPLYALPIGLTTGLAMASGHLSNASGRPSFYKFLGALPAEDMKFLTLAMKYAEDNSVTARSIYDESPIASSFSPTARIAQVAGKTISSPETLLRSIVFMTYANMLKTSGKFKNDLELLRLAEEKTNISMGDYREGEKAMMFSKLGTLGNAMNTLQTFPINYYNQWGWAAREAKRGNPTPAAVMFITQAAAAGAMGVPGFADADKLWNGIKGLLADHSPKMWDKVKNVDLKQAILDGFGSSGLYGPLSTQSGISFTSRASAPALNEMGASPLSPFVDMARQVGSFANAAASPTDSQKRAQSIMDSIPTGLQGWVETGPLRDETSVQRGGERVFFSPRDLAAREGSVARTPAEESIRQKGFRSQREVEERDATYRARSLEAQSQSVIKGLPGKIYNELRKGNLDNAKDLITLYSRISGKEITDEQIQSEAVKEFTTGKERASMGANTIPGILAIKRLQEIRNATKP